MKTPPEPDYEVGYGKPPKATRFQKGQSGNPRGRTKGSRNLKTFYEEAISAKVTVKVDGGRRVKMTKIEAAIHNTVNKAANGDLRALTQTLEELRRFGIGFGVPEAGTGGLPVSDFYASVIERALAARSPDTNGTETPPEENDG